MGLLTRKSSSCETSPKPAMARATSDQIDAAIRLRGGECVKSFSFGAIIADEFSLETLSVNPFYL